MADGFVGFGDRIVALREFHIHLDQVVLQVYAAETANKAWVQTFIPPFTKLDLEEEVVHEIFEDHVLEHLTKLAAQRAN